MSFAVGQWLCYQSAEWLFAHIDNPHDMYDSIQRQLPPVMSNHHRVDWIAEECIGVFAVVIQGNNKGSYYNMSPSVVCGI